jgi:endonuclease/exonuclease/phosphatase family metal-dependent hydrolase
MEIGGTTRDILYVKALGGDHDTLHIFINHWPSRRGGKNKSEPKRARVAGILRNKTDSVLASDPCAKVIVTGDFNDEPSDKSLYEVLNAGKPEAPFLCGRLYNLSEQTGTDKRTGTYKYRGSWNMLDQFIVSGGLLNDSTGISTCPGCFSVAGSGFLLEKDETCGGQKPYRTYLGPFYKGGFSDHLPVYLDLYFGER